MAYRVIHMWANSLWFCGSLRLAFFFIALAADEPLTAALAAQAQYKLQLAAAREQLLTALDDEIANAAERADLETVREYVAAKRYFQERGELPHSDTLKTAVRQYVEQRRKAVGTLTSIWKTEIAAFKETGDEKRAANLERELKEFVASEEPFLAKATVIERKATGEDSRSEQITESLQEVITITSEYYMKLAKVVREESAVRTREICAKQEEEMREQVSRRLKPKLWKLQFPIVSVQEKSGKRNEYTVQIEPPLETAAVNQEWDVATAWTVTLTRERALRVKSGDILQVTGTPRLVGPTIHPNGVFRRRFPLHGLTELVYIELTNTKVVVVPGARSRPEK